MMIDLEMTDAMFEHSVKAFGEPWGTCIFDKNVLVPRELFPQFLAGEVHLNLTLEEVDTRFKRGWVPFLPMNDGTDDLGFPLYGPSRVGLLHKLLEDGYGREEIDLIVEHEENYIEYVLTDGDTSYEDDDCRLIARSLDEELDSLKGNLAYLRDEQDWPASTRDGELFGGATVEEIEEAIAKVKPTRDYYARLNLDELPPERRARVARLAFRIRMQEEALRCLLLEMERNKIRAGYSPMLAFSGHTCSWDSFEARGIQWKASLSHPLVTEDGSFPIRVPGFLLKGDVAVLTRLVSPTEYQRLWELHDLDQYMKLRAEMMGQKVCPHCLIPIHEGADHRRRYCDESCRRAAKQKRYRERHPDRVIETQQRYWKSLD